MRYALNNPTRMLFQFSLAGTVIVGVALSSAYAAPPYGSPGYLNNWFDSEKDTKKRKIQLCVPATNYRLRTRVQEQGYINVYLGGEIGKSGNVEIRATKGTDVFLLEVDKCTGKVEAENYLRRAVNGR